LLRAEWRRSRSSADLAAGRDSGSDPVAGGLRAPDLLGIDQAVGDLAEEFAVLAGVDLLVQGAEPDAAAVKLVKQAGQVFQGLADVDEPPDDEGAPTSFIAPARGDHAGVKVEEAAHETAAEVGDVGFGRGDVGAGEDEVTGDAGSVQHS
jgi:hypothetical protein